MTCNGTTPVTIKTVHGKFDFALQRFRVDGDEVSYFDLTGQFQQGYISQRLKEFSVYYSNRMSYEEVEALIERVTGEKLLSDQKIWQMVVETAVQVSQQLQEEVSAVLETQPMPAVAGAVDLYDPDQPEVLLLDDAIQVKEQKPSRDKSVAHAGTARGRTRVTTDVMLLEKADGGFQYLTAGIDPQAEEIVSLADVVRAQIIREYGASQEPLPLVAITDGAKAIRARLLALFGLTIPLILDWYHLVKRVTELMSMMARDKTERARHLEELLGHLWRGRVSDAVQYLTTQVQTKNVTKLHDLIGYLEKHQYEIIDYERRQRAGKPIGSGRMEKGVDQVIGQRQKMKGMSWSRKGSKALGILKTVELNHQWQQLWFPERLAA